LKKGDAANNARHLQGQIYLAAFLLPKRRKANNTNPANKVSGLVAPATTPPLDELLPLELELELLELDELLLEDELLLDELEELLLDELLLEELDELLLLELDELLLEELDELDETAVSAGGVPL
jgi:hypothetical protein